MATVKAVPCEVWSRVVGYYRPVRDWNKAKQEEFKDRYQHESEGIAKHFGDPVAVERH